MAFDNRRTYLCYNNKDLIRDGFIHTRIEKEYIPVSSFNISRLKNPPKGVTYVVGKDNETQEITSVKEIKKLLPADKIKIEIDFSKTMKSPVSHPIAPGPTIPGTVGGLLGNLGLGSIGFGGITSGLTEMTYHILDSKTKINQKVEITQEILDTSIIQFDGFPLSVFGIVKENIENFGGGNKATEEENKRATDEANSYKEAHPQASISTNAKGEKIAKIGLDFSNEQLEQLGKFSEGSFLGKGRKRIKGATDSNGLFGGAGDSWLILVGYEGESGEDLAREVVFLGYQKQLFIKIVDDDRTLKFRGDNKDALGDNIYPFKTRGVDGIDATNKQIRIDTSDLKIGDVIYVTHNTTVGDRHLRQNMNHKGSIAQGNTIGIVGWTAAIQSVQDIFDYRIKKWKVPPLPTGISMSNIDQVTDNYTKDDDYKLTLNEFISIDKKQRENSDFELSKTEASEIEGWRLSEAILWGRIDNFFAADHRGILYIRERGVEVNILLPRSSIRDQEWFTDYLESLDFTYPTGAVDPNDPVDEDGYPKKTYLPSDLQKNIEEEIDFNDMKGFLFDTSEIINSLFFDREKTHYYRPFANALKNVSKYTKLDKDTGVGLPHLDILSLICKSVKVFNSYETIDGETITRTTKKYSNFDLSNCAIIDLEYYDLSYGVFDSASAETLKSRSCDNPVDLVHYNYSSMNYDAMNENGPGAWYSSGVLDLSIAEWYPDGLSLDSFWKFETPYFCGSFNADSRVYIEKVGGNSLDNYSWIYVDTDPYVPYNISADSSYDLTESMVVFSDNNVNDCLSYYKINDNFFGEKLSLVSIDKTKNHIRDTYNHTVDGQSVTELYDHNENLIIGQNRILGDSPSFSHGIPITEEIFRVCELDTNESASFWFNKDLLHDTWDDGTSFELSFYGDPPRVNIPYNWYVRYVEVEFNYNKELKVEDRIKEIEKYVSFYFENSESSVSDFFITEANSKNDSIVIRFYLKYYHGGPFQFLGDFWGKVRIKNVKGRFCLGRDISIDQVYNLDTYKINSSQSAVAYNDSGSIFVFYSDVSTGNINIAVSHNNGDTWAYNRDIIRLVAGETATLPFVIKDHVSRYLHLFYVLNDKFLMYKKIDPDLIYVYDGLVEYDIPESYDAGAYDNTLDDPEKSFWGNYSDSGILLRREPSYFIVGSADDEYFLEQLAIGERITDFNNSLLKTKNAKKVQIHRFLFRGQLSEMKDSFNGSPYAVYLANDGVLRLLFESNQRLSIKSSYDYVSWRYDIIEQSIHKIYMDENLNKGFSEDITNIQIVRNDYNMSVLSILYMNNGMLFVRHFQTNLLFSLRDDDGNLQNQQMKSYLEIIDADDTVNPPQVKTRNLPIFLVGNIPESVKTTIKNDIENNILTKDSDLAFSFPYKDPDNSSDINANKAMVDIFNNNFEIDTSTQVYAFTTAKGLIRVFYKDVFGNIDGIIIDSLVKPNLEVMNVFKGT